MADARALSIPVILGTTRKGRMSAHVARFVTGQLEKWERRPRRQPASGRWRCR